MSRSRNNPPKVVVTNKAAAQQPPEKPLGRPQGAANIKSEVDVVVSSCKTCGSTERSKYFGTPLVQEFNGEHNGEPYTHIVRRRCTCKKCGQTRLDRSYENRKI